MSFLLDTDICSAHLRQISIVQNRFLQYTGQLRISAVTLAELAEWILRKNTPAHYVGDFKRLLQDVDVLSLDETVGLRAGELGARLRDVGLPMDTSDLLIAATALIHGLTIVTHNTQDFVNVPGLAMVDWLIL